MSDKALERASGFDVRSLSETKYHQMGMAAMDGNIIQRQGFDYGVFFSFLFLANRVQRASFFSLDW